jgi:AAA+ superfamily predicted ATPase
MSNAIADDIKWLVNVLETRLAKTASGGEALPPPPRLKGNTHYAGFIADKKLLPPDRLLLALALSSVLEPGLLEEKINALLPKDGDYPQLGGTKTSQHRGFLPTGETALFLLGGSVLEDRLEAWYWLRNESILYKERIIKIAKPTADGEPPQSGVLTMDAEMMEEILYGESAAPPFSMEFPAKRIETNLEWDDLILSRHTEAQLNELRDWLEKRDELQKWGIAKHIKQGYRSLFYGPPGTGKTLAASILGKYTGTEVFLVDLSMVVSKYIGETEKNLSMLFDKARNKKWILFFDEADSLFGKRTSVRDAHDKYANQEVSYLLQRVEDFPGLVILASNLKGNIDEAFLRRFQSVIHFPMPGPKERFQLWKLALAQVPNPPKDAVLRELAQRFELSGANIVNAVHYGCLRVLAKEKGTLEDFVKKGIQRELQKEGKIT